MRRLLFFHAPWCPPCRFYEREFIEAIEDMAEPGQVVRINVQNDPFIAEKYLIDKLPSIVLLDGAAVKMSSTGAIDIREVAGWLKGGTGYGSVNN